MNDLFASLFFGSLAIIILVAILRRIGATPRLVGKIAASWMRDGKPDQAASAILGALTMSLITREQADQIRAGLGLPEPEPPAAHHFNPPALSIKQIEDAKQKAAHVAGLSYGDRRLTIARLIMENMGLLMECNQHRLMAGIPPREVYQ